MALTMLDYALRYRRQGFSVIPCKRDKKPYIKWDRYKFQKPTEDEIKQWWGEHPEANIAIVCGAVSGVDVLDLDTEEAFEVMNDYYLADSFSTPTVKTPKGRHLYFQHRGGLSNQVRAIPGTDLRTAGGYVIAPPSKNGKGGAYYWIEGLAPKDIGFSAWPDELFSVLEMASHGSQAAGTSSSINNSMFLKESSKCVFKETSNSNKHANKNKESVLSVTNRNIRNISFDEGGRDDSLFHLVWHLKKSGMPIQEIEIYAKFFASKCSPPFPADEINEKIKSALERKKRSDNGLTEAIREFLSVTKGNFSVTSVYQIVTSVTNTAERASVRAILHRMAKEGIIKRDETRDGYFRKIENDCEVIDFKNCKDQPSKISLPLGLNELVEIYPGNVILVAGVSNMGKTSFLIDIIARNMRAFDTWYFNSEMDGKELSRRLREYRAVDGLNSWNFQSRGVTANLEDVVARGEGKLNIIDYLEVDKDFYLIPGKIRAIHEVLKGAIAIIAIQKKPGAEVGVGGYGTVNKARLALNIEKGICEIMKAKNWASSRNPNQLKRHFELVDGWDICGRGDWFRDL